VIDAKKREQYVVRVRGRVNDDDNNSDENNNNDNNNNDNNNNNIDSRAEKNDKKHLLPVTIARQEKSET
jgi:hypothetical protein